MVTNHTALDPITFAVLRNGLLSAAREMYSVFKRTTMLPLLYEANDFGISVYDAQQRLVADAPGLPVFIGTLDFALRETVRGLGGREALREGDVLLNNHPYLTAGQPPDMALMMPLFADGEIIGYAALRGHMGDVGGMNSYPLDSTSLFQEGVIYPGVKLFDGGELNATVVEMLRANSRFPAETVGNIMAGVGALRACDARVRSLVERHGADAYHQTTDEIVAHGERVMRRAVDLIPDGTYSYEDYLDDDASGLTRDEPVKIACVVTIDGSEVTIDLSDSSAQVAGSMNCPLGMTVCICRFALKRVATPDLPPSAGEFNPVSIVVPEGNMFNPVPPAATFLSWASSLRLGDVIVQALAAALPDRIPAENGGDIVATFGILEDLSTGRHTVWLENGAIGHGAVNGRDGMTTLAHPAVAGFQCPPAEMVETRSPVVKHRFELRTDSGGPGAFRGGLAATAEFEIRNGRAEIVALAEKSRASQVHGLHGGFAAPEQNTLMFFPGTEKELVEGKRTRIAMESGERLVISAAGGGGWGDPLTRDLSRIRWDLKNGYISREVAATVYGVVFDEGNGEVDEAATLENRGRQTASVESGAR